MRRLVVVVVFLLMAGLLRRKRYTQINIAYTNREDWVRYWSRMGRCPR